MPLSLDEQIRLYDQARNGGYQRRPGQDQDFKYDAGQFFNGNTQANQNAARSTQLQQRYNGESDAGYNSRMDQRFGDYARSLGLKDWGEGADLVRRALPGGQMEAMRAGVRADEEKRVALDNQIKDFYNRMNSQLDPNDPEVRAAMAMGTNTGQRVSRDRGLRGGLSTSGIVQSSQNALNPMRQFRQQQALQALGLLSGRDLSQRQIGLQEAGSAREAQNEQWAKQQALMQMIVSGIGTVGSAIAAPFTGGATVPGIIGGAAAFGDGVGKYAGAGRPASGSKSAIANGKASGGTGF